MVPLKYYSILLFTVSSFLKILYFLIRSVTMLVGFSVLVSCNQFFGDPIQCDMVIIFNTVGNIFLGNKNIFRLGWLAQRKNVRFIKSFSVGTWVWILLPAKRRHEFFARKFLQCMGNPDSSTYVSGIWNWTKRYLLRTNCRYFSLRENVKNSVTWRNGPRKRWCHIALVPAVRTGWHSCGTSQSPRR